MKPKIRRLALVVGGVVAALGYVLLLWRGPWWIDGAHLREKGLQPADGVVITGFRTMLVAVGAGAIAGLGLYYTHRNHRHAEKLYEHGQEQFAHVREKDREQAELTREGQVTERYVEAIKLLGSSNLHERLGGIYSLERIMNDSERDHGMVVEVLSAFVRTPPPEGSRSSGGTGKGADEGSAEAPRDLLAADVTAALTVLGRQPVRQDDLVVDLRGSRLAGATIRGGSLQGVNLQGVDLTGARIEEVGLAGAQLGSATLTGASIWKGDLAYAIAPGADLTGVHVADTKFTNVVLSNALLVGADLSYVDLSHAFLHGADLTGAVLTKAVLRYASLEHAVLKGAKLEGADLAHADLVGAKLPDADLTGAVLSRANLAHADLTDARLAAADLSDVQGLSIRQLLKAHISSDTNLPEKLADDPQVRRRIAECDAAETKNGPDGGADG
ncbi:pentapeptide repeat-containing protein [Streptomyces sp. NBC_01304]|uniref:pentapeptide repeat-containing protein n=1 Tax=Streptomyces sp. NBC_01304 TaxID=2903818 RepID=UPI002E10EE9E|nr:pentapeptide repeat-containing protein [Streptomyces sp. NBC_01304]WSJ90854.1 pentapeptide repeat-containing protein [Streptomyces sp. NBC_01304]